MPFFDELKCWNVIRVGVAYLVAAWLLLQVVDVLAPMLELLVRLSVSVVAVPDLSRGN